MTMDPQDYSSRTRYRAPGPLYRRLNGLLGVPLTRFGLAPRDAITLEVRGRRSGRARRVPILRTRFHGHDHLVSLSGESEWVRNVRADSGRAVVHRRGAREVLLHELAEQDRAPVLAEYLRQGRRRSGDKAAAKQERFYFGLGPDWTTSELEQIAPYYPVFRIEYL